MARTSPVVDADLLLGVPLHPFRAQVERFLRIVRGVCGAERFLQDFLQQRLRGLFRGRRELAGLHVLLQLATRAVQLVV